MIATALQQRGAASLLDCCNNKSLLLERDEGNILKKRTCEKCTRPAAEKQQNFGAFHPEGDDLKTQI